MDLTTITTQDFKDLFYRDFPYLNIWSDTETYNTDDVVYYETTKLFYKCLNDSVSSVPTDTDDWERTTGSIYNYVLDADITKAFIEAKQLLNQSLFNDNEGITLGYLYLTAHFLVLDLQRSSQGINSRGTILAQSQSVGSVSESGYLPDKMYNNIIFQQYLMTGYGYKYLNLVMPKLVGNVFCIEGGTNA